MKQQPSPTHLRSLRRCNQTAIQYFIQIISIRSEQIATLQLRRKERDRSRELSQQQSKQREVELLGRKIAERIRVARANDLFYKKLRST